MINATFNKDGEVTRWCLKSGKQLNILISELKEELVKNLQGGKDLKAE